MEYGVTYLGRVAVTDGYEPPSLPGRLEAPVPAAPEEARVVPGNKVALTPAVHDLAGQVDELIVLHLQDALLLPAVGQVGLRPVHYRPLGLRVVVQVQVLHGELLNTNINHQYLTHSLTINHQDRVEQGALSLVEIMVICCTPFRTSSRHPKPLVCWFFVA